MTCTNNIINVKRQSRVVPIKILSTHKEERKLETIKRLKLKTDIILLDYNASSSIRNIEKELDKYGNISWDSCLNNPVFPYPFSNHFNL